MKQTALKTISNVLRLDNRVVGLRMFTFADEFDALPVKELEGGLTVCSMISAAIKGAHFKASDRHFACAYGKFTLGIGSADPRIIAGDSYARCGLYESYSIAHEVTREMKFHQAKVYGIEMGPLDEMESADSVIIVCNTEQGMRILQGYAWRKGSPQNLCTVGNQAACSDVISKVIENNDINLTLWCKGARMAGGYGDGEMGFGLPIQFIDDLAEGLAATVNPVCTNEAKRQIADRFQSWEINGAPIVENTDYGVALAKYDMKLLDEAVAGAEKLT